MCCCSNAAHPEREPTGPSPGLIPDVLVSKVSKLAVPGPVGVSGGMPVSAMRPRRQHCHRQRAGGCGACGAARLCRRTRAGHGKACMIVQYHMRDCAELRPGPPAPSVVGSARMRITASAAPGDLPSGLRRRPCGLRSGAAVVERAPQPTRHRRQVEGDLEGGQLGGRVRQGSVLAPPGP
jgi:hypothetical protein